MIIWQVFVYNVENEGRFYMGDRDDYAIRDERYCEQHLPIDEKVKCVMCKHNICYRGNIVCDSCEFSYDWSS